ncbi:hypothetical protein U9M48_001208 [Paspalum notatum var. saurae]|uniref:non-specific serine/threonine protein kinase n=1 Tax=Paspalum notatum var. saurae TaxID=547442 RepID=A0AAQ3PHY5_PASNO
MADPVATVEKIVKIGLAIKDAVDTVRRNQEDCNEIRRRVLRFSAILSQLQQTGMMNNTPALSGALEDLEETLQHALELVTACQETSTIRRLFTAGELSKNLRRVKDDILNKVMLASFAIHAQTTIVLLTIQAGGHPLPQQPEDARVADVPHNILHSAEDARSELKDERNTVLTGSDAPFYPFVGLRNFNLSDLKAAISGGYVIAEGGFVKVYQCLLNDGNVVAVKVFKKTESRLDWPSLSRIIEGLAQGIHYLHKQHVVHMDVKPSNILLDSEMNPKITDFHLSLVLNDDENEITDNRVAGTLGYLPPEYVSCGIVSVKNDVYGFGSTLLQTVSTLYLSDSDLPFSVDTDMTYLEAVRKAWSAWGDGRMEGLFDPSLFDGCDQLMEIKRCMQVGLLCVQDERADRPTMADVLAMLHGEKEMPSPKKPTYFKVSDEEE